MVPKTPNVALDALLPDRHPQPSLFVCDVADAVLKDILQHMEHPFYSLSKKPETNVRSYEHNGNKIEVIPSVKGLATIYDKDILIYCISQVIATLNRGEKVSQRVRINTHDLLVFTNRGTGGKDYKALSDALDRLAGTRIVTNIKTGDEEQYDNFGLIETASMRRKHGLDGRLLWCEIKLSDWVFNAIRSQEVLTLNPLYFRLRKPLERRVYELARKHCGKQKSWTITLNVLLKKSGSKSQPKKFRQLIKDIAKNNHLPDYGVLFDEQEDKIIFYNRSESMTKWYKREEKTEVLPDHTLPPLKSATYEKARQVAPRYDIYFLEQEWREFWSLSGKPTLQSPDGAFISFCKKRYEKNPLL
jgi:plasmid replication initiation protein